MPSDEPRAMGRAATKAGGTFCGVELLRGRLARGLRAAAGLGSEDTVDAGATVEIGEIDDAGTKAGGRDEVKDMGMAMGALDMAGMEMDRGPLVAGMTIDGKLFCGAKACGVCRDAAHQGKQAAD